MTRSEEASLPAWPQAVSCEFHYRNGGTQYVEALEVCAKIRYRPEIALTRLQLAELILEHYPDERASAIEDMDFAIGEFRT